MDRETVVVDACAMINLRRGQLLDLLPYLDCQLVIPVEIRLELTRFTRADWSLLDGSGMRTFALPRMTRRASRGREPDAFNSPPAIMPVWPSRGITPTAFS